MTEDKEIQSVKLTLPSSLNKRLCVALNEVIDLAPHGMLSKNTISTVKDLQLRLSSSRSDTKTNNKLPN